MKALITGAGGQLGRALREAVPAGATVAALARAELDVCDSEAVAAAVARERPDIVLNASGYTAVDRAESESEAAFALNGDAPGMLAAAARQAGARFVHVSTDFVFDGRSGSPYPPDAQTNPLSVYGASKLAGEAAVRAADPGALIVRTAWVYAAWGGNFVRTMLGLMGERDEVRVVADQVGTPTHAASLARGLWALAGTGASGTHHLTDAGVASWYDLAVAVQEEALALGLLDRRVPVRPVTTADFPTPARRPGYSVLDKASAWALLGGPGAHWRDELRLMLGQLKEDIGG